MEESGGDGLRMGSEMGLDEDYEDQYDDDDSEEEYQKVIQDGNITENDTRKTIGIIDKYAIDIQLSSQ